MPMLYKKSFNLNNNEKKTENTDKLYQPKKFRWCKCIVFPLLLGFILLLILTNVDFTGEAYKGTWLEMDSNIISPTTSSLTNYSNCEQNLEDCSFTCYGREVGDISPILELVYQNFCKNMTLILEYCSFPNATLTNDFLEGNFSLAALYIIHCNLHAIHDKAFEHDSVKNLTSLTLAHTQFETLGKTTFEGLEQLESFILINDIPFEKFQGNGFLEPLSKTLKYFHMTQNTTNEIYDPINWLKGSDMKVLHLVEFNNNNFENRLAYETFSNLVAVEKLILWHCKLTYIPANTFDGILKTLKYLDLSYNQLTVLPGDMFLNMKTLNLSLSYNPWDCSCQNIESFDVIPNYETDINFVEREYMVCGSPRKEYAKQLYNVQLECKGYNSDTTEFINMTSADESDEDPSQNITPTTVSSVITIECLGSSYHDISKEKCKFHIYPVATTSVIINLSDFLSNVEILYFSNSKNSNQLSTNKLRQQNFAYSILIDDLDPKLDYVFCLIHNKAVLVSPFDCQGYVRPKEVHKPWILRDDQAWIICLVIFVSFLLLFLGIVLVISFHRLNKCKISNCLNTILRSKSTANKQNVSGVCLKNVDDSDMYSMSVYYCQDKSTDVIVPHINDDLYEDIITYKQVWRENKSNY